MKKIIEDPRLDHFTLISKRLMIGYLKPGRVKYTTLIHLGAAVLQESKRSFLFDYYFSLLPKLLAEKTIQSAKSLYIDTGSNRRGKEEGGRGRGGGKGKGKALL